MMITAQLSVKNFLGS